MSIATSSSSHLTSGRLLARNATWNLLGNVAPMIVAIVAIPLLVRGLGKDRFGVLTLAWALIGYASLFDLGLGRALTQLVAKKLGTGEDREIPTLVWTSMLLMLGLGLVGGVVVVLASPWLVHRTLNVPHALQLETLRSFYLLGLSIPVVISTAGLRGLLEAYQRFGLINALRVPMGVFTFGGPLLVLPFSRSLFLVVGVLVVGRVVAWVAHLLLCFRVLPALTYRIAWQRAVVAPLLQFGGWMTVTNIVGPLMVTLDRFVIGAMLTVTAVAYYVIPYEVVTKLSVIPGALVVVMFPAFSASLAQNPDRTVILYRRSVKCAFLVLFPIVLLILVLAPEGLRLWLGAEFSHNSSGVLRWLAVGVFINSLAGFPFALVQGAGRPDLTAKLHLLELPAYLLALWWLIRARGIEGAAIAWSIRAAVDALILFSLAPRFLPRSDASGRRNTALVILALATLVSATLPQSIFMKGTFLVVAALAFAFASWFLILTPDERSLAQNLRVAD